MAVGEREKEKLSEVLIRKILNNHYDIGKIESITHLEEGHESDNSKVETDRGRVKFIAEPKRGKSKRFKGLRWADYTPDFKSGNLFNVILSGNSVSSTNSE